MNFKVRITSPVIHETYKPIRKIGMKLLANSTLNLMTKLTRESLIIRIGIYQLSPIISNEAIEKRVNKRSEKMKKFRTDYPLKTIPESLNKKSSGKPSKIDEL